MRPVEAIAFAAPLLIIGAGVAYGIWLRRAAPVRTPTPGLTQQDLDRAVAAARQYATSAHDDALRSGQAADHAQTAVQALTMASRTAPEAAVRPMPETAQTAM